MSEFDLQQRIDALANKSTKELTFREMLISAMFMKFTQPSVAIRLADELIKTIAEDVCNDGTD